VVPDPKAKFITLTWRFERTSIPEYLRNLVRSRPLAFASATGISLTDVVDHWGLRCRGRVPIFRETSFLDVYWKLRARPAYCLPGQAIGRGRAAGVVSAVQRASHCPWALNDIAHSGPIDSLVRLGSLNERNQIADQFGPQKVLGRGVKSLARRIANFLRRTSSR